jgi:hypothetical protein
MFLPYISLKIIGVRAKGPERTLKNIEKSPKGPRFREGDKQFLGVPPTVVSNRKSMHARSGGLDRLAKS